MGRRLSRLVEVVRSVASATSPSSSSDPAGSPGRPARPGTAGSPQVGYAPRPDGLPDPGEVVWAWVPYEDDASQGKDRPVLVLGTDGALLLALAMTSKDHDRDEEQERRAGREWLDVGSGAWDRERRPSEVRVNRVLRLAPDDVRREGAALDRATFERVVEAARPHL